MLTRLEVNGFKNLIDFSTDFGPFTCIAGPNGVGKSNILDVVRFLSLLTDHTLMDAALRVRGTDPETADPADLFWTDGADRSTEITISAEMIVGPHIEDDFGRPAKATSTFLRYELAIGREDASGNGNLGRLVLLSESLKHISESDARRRLRFKLSARNFRKTVIVNTRRSPGFISTEQAPDGPTEIHVHQDGGSRGRPHKAPAAGAPRTIVGTTNTSVTPTILAARREMQSWRFLSLEPSAMRGADRVHTDPHISASGDHLAATLYRLARDNENSSASPDAAYARVAGRLSEIIPVEEVRVNLDEVRQLLTLEVRQPSGPFLPTRSLSDGTLRFLTLCVIAEDPEFRGLLCMEEPENGIHPEKMPAMVELLRDLAVDPQETPGPDNPMRQVIVATHSPPLVQLQDEDDLLFAELATVRTPNGIPTVALRCKPMQGAWRESETLRGVGKGSIIAYLSKPPGAQLDLEPTSGWH